VPTSAPGRNQVFHLRTQGVSLVVDTRHDGIPTVVHWGAALVDLVQSSLIAAADGLIPGVPSNSIDEPSPVGLLPEHARGYAGRASLEGSRAARDWSTLFTTVSAGLVHEESGGQLLTVRSADRDAGLELTSELRMTAAGVVMLRHSLQNLADSEYELLGLPFVLPLPGHAREILDLTGRHLRERSPQRLPLQMGAWVREQRRGRTGHDFPLFLAAGVPGFTAQQGEVWAVHVAWSGNTTTFVERLPDGWACLGGGELLQPTEIVLAPGATYVGPWVYAAYSTNGLDQLSARFHDMLRSRPTHPSSPRPVVLNTWEAVYFNHDLDNLRDLADVAATVGVERFVLDDGWFGGRRNDAAGLGDWYVSPEVWPSGLHPLIEHVHHRGMEFGLWVEPEMVNPDSALAREHPDWLMGLPGRMPPAARNQQLLDIANPHAFAYLLERLDALLTEYPISYLKWDHNRDVIDAVHAGLNRRWPGVHRQTLALYRLIDEIRRRHPAVEIESCAGGGGRVDLGILRRTDRIWVSDNNDPHERQCIQRWTNVVIPYELMGAHIGPPKAHTTGRRSDLGFRAGTAMFGHFGIEWDITRVSAEDLKELAEYIAIYKRKRGLLHSGRVVHGETGDAAATVHGVVSHDQRDALYAFVMLDTGTSAPLPRIRLPGLDPATTYRVEAIDPTKPMTIGTASPPWWVNGVTLPGATIGNIGLAAPLLAPQQLTLLQVVAI
jgi:alpha-galactosidase